MTLAMSRSHLQQGNSRNCRIRQDLGVAIREHANAFGRSLDHLLSALRDDRLRCRIQQLMFRHCGAVATQEQRHGGLRTSTRFARMRSASHLTALQVRVVGSIVLQWTKCCMRCSDGEEKRKTDLTIQLCEIESKRFSCRAADGRARMESSRILPGRQAAK